MIALARPSLGKEEEAAVTEVLRSGWVAQGPTTGKLEEEFADFVGVEHAIATSSCTTALHLAIVAAGIGPGDEVILPSYTFPATANAVLYEGGIPVLVDIEADTLNIDVAKAREAITPRTKVIIGVHLFGCPCDVRALKSLCDENDLVFIEDAACAVGTTVGGEQAGSFGDIACFSFHARKVVTCGEGGMLTTGNAEVAEKLQSLRTHGVDRSAEVRHCEGLAPDSAMYVRLGYNYRLSDIQAAIARVQMRRLPDFLRERDELAKRYEEAFAELPLRLPPRIPDASHSYQSFVVIVEPNGMDPLKFRDELGKREVSTRVGTYAIHCQPYFKDSVPTACTEALSVSDEAATNSVALPLYNGLSTEDQNRVIAAVREVLS